MGIGAVASAQLDHHGSVVISPITSERESERKSPRCPRVEDRRRDQAGGPAASTGRVGYHGREWTPGSALK